MALSLSETQAFLAKQAQLWQDQSSRLSDTSQDMQWLRDEEAQAVLQLEAEKVVALLQRQLDIWTDAAKGHLVQPYPAVSAAYCSAVHPRPEVHDLSIIVMYRTKSRRWKIVGAACTLQSPKNSETGTLQPGSCVVWIK